MGMFDKVWVDCPNCGNPVEFQSKAGGCNLDKYTLETAPVQILLDIMNIPEHCDCGAWLAVIDPRVPASLVRPEVAVVKVKPPENPHTYSGEMFWPGGLEFTKDDIEEND